MRKGASSLSKRDSTDVALQPNTRVALSARLSLSLSLSLNTLNNSTRSDKCLAHRRQCRRCYPAQSKTSVAQWLSSLQKLICSSLSKNLPALQFTNTSKSHASAKTLRNLRQAVSFNESHDAHLAAATATQARAPTRIPSY